MSEMIKETENKPIINIVPGDFAGCGYYRLIQVGNMLQLYGHDVTISPAGKFRAAAGQTITFTQRMCAPSLLEKLIAYKKQTGHKFIVDFDDLLWVYEGESLPDYNLCKTKVDCAANTEAMKKWLNELADKVTVSTEFLKKTLLQFVPEEKIILMPNMLSYKEWFFPLTKAPDENIFFYAGSYTHYDNIHKQPGDFDKNLIHYLNNQKIITKASTPYFMKPLKQCPASRLTTYAADFYRETRECKFVLAPLADNVFNKCKSDLKYLECAAVGRVCLVSDFEGSPYSGAHPYQKIPVGSTSQGIKYIVDRATEHYDEIVQYQLKYLNDRWLDNHINEYVNILQ